MSLLIVISHFSYGFENAPRRFHMPSFGIQRLSCSNINLNFLSSVHKFEESEDISSPEEKIYNTKLGQGHCGYDYTPSI